MATNEDNRMNRKRVKGFCRLHSRDYTNSTLCAEACADELDLCDDDAECTIPEYVFEITMSYYDDNGPLKG